MLMAPLVKGLADSLAHVVSRLPLFQFERVLNEVWP